MDDLKRKLEQQLIANIIKDKCDNNDNIIFDYAWSSVDRIIRFTTPFFRNLFKNKNGELGKWKTGDFIMFEALNGERFIINCVFSYNDIKIEDIDRKNKILDSFSIEENDANEAILKSWDFSYKIDVNEIFEQFDNLILKDLPIFEKEIEENINSYDELHEGSKEYIMSLKYERNRKAREKCLEHYGTKCIICGIDFGKEYGPEFAGKIEVHHVVPISMIKEDYVVDPIKDLVPVCPNCHAALHSKKDGVYTVNELKEKMGKE